MTVHTARAECGVEDKELLIKAIFTNGGGFDRIDNQVTKFRQDAVMPVMSVLLKDREDLLPKIFDAVKNGDETALNFVIRRAKKGSSCSCIQELAQICKDANHLETAVAYTKFTEAVIKTLFELASMHAGSRDDVKYTKEAKELTKDLLASFANPWRNNLRNKSASAAEKAYLGLDQEECNRARNAAKGGDSRLSEVRERREEVKRFLEKEGIAYR